MWICIHSYVSAHANIDVHIGTKTRAYTKHQLVIMVETIKILIIIVIDITIVIITMIVVVVIIIRRRRRITRITAIIMIRFNINLRDSAAAPLAASRATQFGGKGL